MIARSAANADVGPLLERIVEPRFRADGVGTDWVAVERQRGRESGELVWVRGSVAHKKTDAVRC